MHRNAKQINQDFDLLFFPISALKSLAVTKAMPTFFALNSKKIPRLVGVKFSWFIYCAFLTQISTLQIENAARPHRTPP